MVFLAFKSGQEMCRTKFGVENSYRSSDKVNMIRWARKLEYADVVAYYRGLIHLRRSNPSLFCMTDSSVVRSNVAFFEDIGLSVPSQCIAYRVRSSASPSSNAVDECWREVVVLLNASASEVSFALPEADSYRHWIKVVDAQKAGCDALDRPIHGKSSVRGRSAAMFRRASDEENHTLVVPLRLNHVSDADCGAYTFAPTPYSVGLTRLRSNTDQRLGGLAGSSIDD